MNDNVFSTERAVIEKGEYTGESLFANFKIDIREIFHGSSNKLFLKDLVAEYTILKAKIEDMESKVMVLSSKLIELEHDILLNT